VPQPRGRRGEEGKPVARKTKRVPRPQGRRGGEAGSEENGISNLGGMGESPGAVVGSGVPAVEVGAGVPAAEVRAFFVARKKRGGQFITSHSSREAGLGKCTLVRWSVTQLGPLVSDTRSSAISESGKKIN
jgi:hypothetical protein